MKRFSITKKQIDLLSYLVYILVFWHYYNVLGFQGMDYLLCPILLLYGLSILFFGQLSKTLGKLLRFRYAKGHVQDAGNCKKSVLIMTLINSLLLIALLLLLTNPLWLSFLKKPYAVLPFYALLPGFFFQNMQFVIEGWLLGEQKVSFVTINTFIKPIFYLLLSKIAITAIDGYGQKISNLLGLVEMKALYMAVAAGLAISLSEIIVFIISLLEYFFCRAKGVQNHEANLGNESGLSQCFLLLQKMSYQNLIHFLLFLPLLFGLLFIRTSTTAAEAAASFSQFFAEYILVVLLISILLLLYGMRFVDKTLICIKREEKRFTRESFASVIHYIFIMGLLFSALVTLQGDCISSIFRQAQPNQTIDCFLYGGFVIFFMSAILLCGPIIEKLGGKKWYLLSLAIGNIVIAILMIFDKNRFENPYCGLAFHLFLGYLCAFLILFAICYKKIGTGFMVFTQLAVPGIAVSVSALLFVILHKVLRPILGAPFVLLLSAVIGYMVTVFLIIVFQNLRDYEQDLLPFGKKILNLCKRIGIYR